MKYRVLLMDNSVHMFKGGGQVFFSQLQSIVLKEKDIDLKVLNSESLTADPINRTVCRFIDAVTKSLMAIFPSFTTIGHATTFLDNLNYYIRLKRLSHKIPKGERFDLIVSNDLTDLFVIEKRNLKAVDLILVFHNPFIREIFADSGKQGLAKEVFDVRSYVDRSASKFNTTMVVINKEQERILSERYQSAIVNIPNGIDTDIYSPQQTSESKNFDLLFVGRLDESQKRISTLIKMVAEMEEARLTIVGDGPSRHFYEDMIAASDLERRVRLLGHVGDREKIESYRKAKLFVSASMNEGLSYTFLEAMSCGLPVVSFPNGASLELIDNGRNGYIVNSADEFISILMEMAHSMEKITEMGKSARKTILKRYSLESMSRSYITLIRDNLTKVDSSMRQ